MRIAPGAPPTVLLTRHGTSEHNLNTRFFMGRTPTSRLTDLGRDQARKLGTYLAAHRQVGRIVVSSLPRTIETADLVSQCLGGVPVYPEDAFWELSKGDWEGRMPRDAVPEPDRSTWDKNPYTFRFPGGESFADVAERVVPAYFNWLQTFPDEGLLFVLHGDVICTLLQAVLKLPPANIRDMLVKPCSLTELARNGDDWRLLRFSDDLFLGPG